MFGDILGKIEDLEIQKKLKSSFDEIEAHDRTIRQLSQINASLSKEAWLLIEETLKMKLDIERSYKYHPETGQVKDFGPLFGGEV